MLPVSFIDDETNDAMIGVYEEFGNEAYEAIVILNSSVVSTLFFAVRGQT